MRRLLLAMVLTGCALELPTPPNLAPLNAQYEEPTAELGPETAGSILAAYDIRLREMETLGNLKNVRRLVNDFDQSVTVTQDGDQQTVEIDGAPIRADAIIRLYEKCREESDVEEIMGRAVVRDSRLVPTIWGSMEACWIAAPADAPFSESVVSGDISVFAPTLGTDETPVVLIEYVLGSVVVDGEPRTPFSGSVRVVDTLFEFLVRTQQEKSVVVFGRPDPAHVGVRAANGVWECFLQERRCEDESSDASFSY